MFETAKLRGRIVEKYGTIGDFAKAVKRPISYVSQYLNGKKNLDQVSIDLWARALDIGGSDIDAYFFTRRVHETEQPGL